MLYNIFFTSFLELLLRWVVFMSEGTRERMPIIHEVSFRFRFINKDCFLGFTLNFKSYE